MTTAPVSRRPGWAALPAARDMYAGFAKEGGRVGSGALGAGTGGVARCV
ncbi:hypothetical protein [Streptomyces sp. NPDC007088]